MNQKIIGIIPLLAAMMFVAVFAAGDNQAVAATVQDTQTATVTVSESIGISVNPDATMSATAAGGNVGSNSYTISNTGNSRIDAFISSGSEFTCLTSGDTIPVAAAGDNKYFITIGSTNTNIPSDIDQKAEIITNLPTHYQSASGSSVSAAQTLNVPAGIEQGVYTNTLTYTAITTTASP